MPFLDLNGLNHFKDKMMALLNGKLNEDLKGASNGLAELDSTGKVPSAQLPSALDDVREYASASVFPETGETGIIYVSTSDNKLYRWGGEAYVELTTGESGGGSSEGVKIFYGECETATSERTKIVNGVEGFALTDGVMIIVNFKNNIGTYDASFSPHNVLNVNGTGPISIYDGPNFGTYNRIGLVLLRYNATLERYYIVSDNLKYYVRQQYGADGNSFLLGSNSSSALSEESITRKLPIQYLNSVHRLKYYSTSQTLLDTRDLENVGGFELVVNKYGYNSSNVETISPTIGSDDDGETYYFIDPYTNEKRYTPNAYVALGAIVKKYVVCTARVFVNFVSTGGVAAKLAGGYGEIGTLTFTAYDTDNNVIYTKEHDIYFTGQYIEYYSEEIAAPTFFEAIACVPYDNLGRVNVTVTSLTPDKYRFGFTDSSLLTTISRDYDISNIQHELAYTDVDYQTAVFNPTTVEVFNFHVWDSSNTIDQVRSRHMFPSYDKAISIVDNSVAKDHAGIMPAVDGDNYPFVNVRSNSTVTRLCLDSNAYNDGLEKLFLVNIYDYDYKSYTRRLYITDGFDGVFQVPTKEYFESIEERLSALEA